MTAAPETGCPAFSTMPEIVPVVTPWAFNGAAGASRVRTARTAMAGKPSHSGTFDSFMNNSKEDFGPCGSDGRPSVPTGCNGTLTPAGADVVRLRIVLKKMRPSPLFGATAMKERSAEETRLWACYLPTRAAPGGWLFARAGGLRLVANLLRLVAPLVRFLQQRLLAGRVLFEVGLDAQEQVLVGQRLEVVRVQLDGLVHRLEPLLDELHLVGFGRREVAIRLLPVVSGDRVVRLGVFRLV